MYLTFIFVFIGPSMIVINNILYETYYVFYLRIIIHNRLRLFVIIYDSQVELMVLFIVNLMNRLFFLYLATKEMVYLNNHTFYMIIDIN